MAATQRRRDVISELYTSLCGDPELPVESQWRVYRYTVREKKFALMARLLTIPKLDPALDAELGSRSESKVLAAWIARAGRPTEAVLDVLERARKGPVYPAAAALPGLPKEVYRKLVADGRTDTARQLLANPDAPRDVKETAAALYGRKSTTKQSYRCEQELKGLFTDQLGLLRHLVSETANCAVLAWAAKHVSLPADDVSRILETVLMPALTDPEQSASWETNWGIEAAITAFLGQPLSPTDRSRLYQAGRRWVARTDRGNPQRARDELDKAFNAGQAHLPTDGSQHLSLMRSAETPEDLATAVKIVLASQDQELATALVSNRAADAATVEKVLNVVPKTIRGHLARARATDIAVLATIVVYNDGYDIFSDELLAASGQPSEALVAIVRKYREAGKQVSVRLGRSEYLTPSVMGALPLSFTSKKGSMLARRAVGDLLTRALTSDRDWELFETLGNNFDGPLENLLLACGYVVAPPSEEEPPAAKVPAHGDDPDVVVDPDGIATWALF